MTWRMITRHRGTHTRSGIVRRPGVAASFGSCISLTVSSRIRAISTPGKLVAAVSANDFIDEQCRGRFIRSVSQSVANLFRSRGSARTHSVRENERLKKESRRFDVHVGSCRDCGRRVQGHRTGPPHSALAFAPSHHRALAPQIAPGHRSRSTGIGPSRSRCSSCINCRRPSRRAGWPQERDCPRRGRSHARWASA